MACIDIPLLNPIRFNRTGVLEDKTANAHYTDYLQKYNKQDITMLQFIVNCGLDPTFEVYKQGILQPITIYSYTTSYGSFRALNYSIDFSLFQDGIYRLKLYTANETYWSNEVWICDEHPYTQFFSYYNNCNEQGVAFSTGVIFGIRAEMQMYNAM